jgi:hypothetical protein
MSAPTLISIAAFVSRYSRGLRRAPRARLLPFLTWFWRDARIAVVRCGGRIVGVAFGRCLDRPEQATNPYYHDEQAKLVWIDDIVCRHPQAVPTLLSLAMQRFGPREAFAGHVFTRNGELRMLPWKTVERLSQGTMEHVDQSTSAAGRA